MAPFVEPNQVRVRVFGGTPLFPRDLLFSPVGNNQLRVHVGNGLFIQGRFGGGRSGRH